MLWAILMCGMTTSALGGETGASTEAKRKAATSDDAVSIASFARVLAWNPEAMEGTKAIRSDEIPAEDIAPYKQVLPESDGTYRVPAMNGAGCIGLQWDENRPLRRVEIRFAGAASSQVRLQYWTGESEWQGKWEAAKAAPEKIEGGLAWTLSDEETAQGTQKARWLFLNATEPIVVKGFAAFTRSEWKTVSVRIEAAREGAAEKADIEVYNGTLVGRTGEAAYHCVWDGTEPLSLQVRASVATPCKVDRTVLRFRTRNAAFGVAVEDLLTNDCVYIADANVFVSRDPAPVPPTEYFKKIASRKSMLDVVRQRPDQNFRRVCGVLHNPTQDQHPWCPTLISLACDNRKFLAYRDGSVLFNEYNGPSDYPGESDGVHTTAANVNQWRFVPSFGRTEDAHTVTRRLNGGWLPMPVSVVEGGSITYQQMTHVAPVDKTMAGYPSWLRERALCAMEYRIKNISAQPAEARLALQFKAERDPKQSVEWKETSEGAVVTSGDRVLAVVDRREAGPLVCALGPDGLILSGSLPVGSEVRCVVYLPAWKVAPSDYASVLRDAPWAPRTEKYWRGLLEPAMGIEIPDEFLSNIIRASQVNCMLAARNEEMSRYVVPWISSIHFAYPESEANSIMRGMDLMGHGEFARRGLDFYLSKANPAGFITILVRNVVSGISCGYTLVGTGEVLWTLGEHYERTRDNEWMRNVAPDVVRICKWIMRQREKTQLLDARGEKTPEYGLMPPGVSADWNRFAYRFFNDAQYYYGLLKAGEALAAIGDPAAREILENAKEYRENIMRSYHWLQARMPVVPLRNGTWVPADPSLLGCYGNVEDFLPGEDVNRTYVYSVEIGGHHLAVNGVLDPASKDVDWITDYLEDDQFLRTRWIKDPAKADPYDWGGFAKMQPYYSRVTELHAKRDDVKPFVRSYFNVIPALLNFEDLTFWEDMISDGYASGAMNKTHETGWFLSQTRTMFVTERGDELWLAPFVTNQWLRDGKKIAVRNAPTDFGTVSYTIRSSAARGRMEAEIEMPAQFTARKVVLRLRHPEGNRMRAVTVQGKPHGDFDPQKEIIMIEPNGSKTIKVQAEFEENAPGAVRTTLKPGEPITLDDLPVLPRNVSVYEFSSHNKKGVNGDADWFLYKDERGDAVIFDAMGPGCVRSFWNTCIGPDQILKFYFDGEKEPRYTVSKTDLYQGKHPLFPAPLTSYETLGHYEGEQYAGNCFVPIPFSKSLKITCQGPVVFYHFFYERYPAGTQIATFTGRENRDYLVKAFQQQGEELQPVENAEVIRASSAGIEPNDVLEVLNTQGSGVVTRVVVEGEATEDFLNNVEIHMQWDESVRLDVLAPLGMFCACAVRPENVRALPVKVEKLDGGRIRLTNYFRMPFWSKAFIRIVNRQDKSSGPISVEVHVAPQRYKENCAGYFNALYHDGRTEMARDWLFADAVGTGRFVGVVQTMQGSHYCEGDEHFILDGAGMPQVNGTGSEDYYLGCFWPNLNFNFPFAGSVGDITKQPGPACYYRFHIEAPIPFYQSLDARIQHGGNSDIVSHYRSLGFYYVRKRPAMHLTDFVDVANEASERAHRYKAPKSKLTGEVDASYEGNAAWTLLRDAGRIHESGKIRFTVAIAPENDGVRLRRRLDQNIGRQCADVYVDGDLVGTWYHADENPHLRWYDSEFELPASVTDGKTKLDICLVPRREEGYGAFTDYRYEVLTYEKP
jgi:hypothetical protein